MSGTDVAVGIRRSPTRPSAYLNRELSWLDFNARVLALAEDADLPLLERAKFLAIFSQNLDEFFEVRVVGPDGAARRRPAHHHRRRPRPRRPAPRDPRPGRRRSSPAPAAVFAKEIVPALDDEGIRFADWDDLSDDDRALPRRDVRRDRSSRCSRRSRSTPRTRSRTSRTCRSTSRSPCATRRAATSDSLGSRCRRCSPASCAPRRRALRAARAGHRGQARHAVPRHGGARAPPVPGHPRRRLRARGRSRGPPRATRCTCWPAMSAARSG